MTSWVDKLKDPYQWTPMMVRIYKVLYRLAQTRVVHWLRLCWWSILRKWRHGPYLLSDIRNWRTRTMDLIFDALFYWLLEYRSRRRNNANNP